MKKKGQIIVLICSIIFQSVVCTGCWSSKEVESLAVVTLVGFDLLNENGKDVWRVSALIFNPQSGGKGVNQSGASEAKELLLVGKAETIQGAVLDFTASTSRSPYYDHSVGIVIGANAAKERIHDIIESVIRYPQTRPKELVIVTKGEALQVLQNGSSIGGLLSKELKDLAQNKASASGYSAKVVLSDFTALLESKDRDPVATEVKSIPSDLEESKQENLMEGLAVFRADKLVGWLNKEETMGYILLTQKISLGQIPISVEKDGKIFAYLMGTSKSKIKAVVSGDKISYQVKIKTMGAINDSYGIELNTENISSLESIIGERIRELVMQAVEKSMALDSDFIGFSEKLHRSNLLTWQTLGTDWREAFINSDVEVEVDAKVLKTGKIGKKLEFKKKSSPEP